MLVTGSDALIFSPLFHGLDESPAWTVDPPVMAVSSQRRSEVLAIPTATEGDEPGIYQATLTAADHLDVLDVLDVTWTTPTASRARTYPVAGTVYVSTWDLAQMSAVPETNVAFAVLRAARTQIEETIERARGTAFVPRWTQELHTVPASGTIQLSWPHLRTITGCTIDGFDWDTAGLAVDEATGTITGLPAGSTAVFGYEHGYSQPPPILEEACRRWVRDTAFDQSSDHSRNLLSYTDPATGAVMRFGTADWAQGRFTGRQEIDDLINQVPDERVPVVA